MGKIVSFENRKAHEDRYAIPMPTATEIAVLRNLTKNTPDGELVDIAHWDGDCWRAFFMQHEERAEVLGVDPWDAFAVTLTRMLGTTFDYDEKGNVKVSTAPLPESLLKE